MPASMTKDQIQAVARQLADASQTRRPIDALGLDPASLEEGYLIQDAGHALYGDELVAWKAGCTSDAAQKFLGVSAPVAGRYRSSHVLETPASLNASELVTTPHLEVEVGFRLLADVDQPPNDPMQLADSVEAFAAIEVVGGRLSSFPAVPAPQLVADNVVAARMVVGSTLLLDAAGIRALDTISIELGIAGETVASGVGAAVLGHPLNVLAWLAGHAVDRGAPLRAGHLVITGTCTGLIAARQGEIHIGRVGDGEVRLTVL